ncbi:MAG: glycosyltransferase family 4 protein, partial [candidate division WOR-3 bacterium]
HDIDVIIDDLNKIPFYSTIFTRKRVLPTVMHLFRRTIFRETNPLAAGYVFVAERIAGKVYGRANFVAISHSTKDDLRDIGVRRRIHIVQSGIPEHSGTGKKRRADDLVVYVGRVKSYKSIDHFVRAVGLVSKRRRIKAKIVGDGDALNDLKALAKRIDVDIDFTGFVSEEEKHNIYRTARVVVQPSIKEGWGLTAIEAQSCGTPVVCANSPGLREVVLDGRTGYRYAYGNIDEMADRIVELLADKPKWVRFANEAKRWSRHFSWDLSAQRFEEVLKQEASCSGYAP